MEQAVGTESADDTTAESQEVVESANKNGQSKQAEKNGTSNDSNVESPTAEDASQSEETQAESSPVEEENKDNSESDDATPEGESSEGDVEAEEETPPSDAELVEQLRAELEAVEAKSAEYVDKLQRTAAEFQNSKRRHERLLSESIERASSHLIKQLLPVLDDLDLAFQNPPSDIDEDSSAWVDGFRQIQKKLLNILDNEEVTPIPVEGEFDPTKHEAISSEPSEDVESGHIIDTLRLGYEYKGRVLRPAMVRVAM